MKKKKLSPLAAAIVEGLNEAISYANGEHVQGLHAVEVEVPDIKKKTQKETTLTFKISVDNILDGEKKVMSQKLLDLYSSGVVILPKKEYDNIMENLLIRSNPEDYRRLIESIHQFESSKMNK